jgi:hypothetical protein
MTCQHRLGGGYLPGSACAVHLEESGGLVLHVVDVPVLWPLAASTVFSAAVYLAQRPWFFTASAATTAAAGSR